MSCTARSPWILPADQPFFAGYSYFILFTIWWAKQLWGVLHWSIGSQFLVGFVLGLISDSKPISYGFGTWWAIRNGQGEADLPDKDLNVACSWSQESCKSYQKSWQQKSRLFGWPEPLGEAILLHFQAKVRGKKCMPWLQKPIATLSGSKFWWILFLWLPISITNAIFAYESLIWKHCVAIGDLTSGAISSAHPVFFPDRDFDQEKIVTFSWSS